MITMGAGMVGGGFLKDIPSNLTFNALH